MTEIDATIDRIEVLYRALMGREVPTVDTPYAPFPSDVPPEVHIADQVDRLVDVLERAPTALGLTPTWTAPISAWEGPKEVLIFVELAGVPLEAVDVTVARNVLTVSGHRPLPVSNGTREYFPRRLEHPLGAFRRQVFLPPFVQEQITAEMKNGLLEIRVPKGNKPSTITQSIPVR